MKAVIAIDSFKGSLSSMEAGKAAAEGIWRVDKDAKIAIRPLADGGEGTVEALTGGMNGEIQTVTVTGPLGEPVKCEYGIITVIQLLLKCQALPELLLFLLRKEIRCIRRPME